MFAFGRPHLFGSVNVPGYFRKLRAQGRPPGFSSLAALKPASTCVFDTAHAELEPFN
jgi:hypothetical protein